MKNTILKNLVLCSAFLLPLTVQAQLTQVELQEMCEMDIELTEYLSAVLKGETPPTEPLSDVHKQEVQVLIQANQGLNVRQQYQKIIEACSKGSAFQGRY